MSSMNKVFLVGNLTRDPELRHTPSGTAVADLGLAVNEQFRNRDGESTETTCFVDLVAWGRQAEAAEEYLAKGSPVLVEGKLQFDRWENKDGQTRTKVKVRVIRMQFLGSPRKETQPAGAPQEELADMPL